MKRALIFLVMFCLLFSSFPVSAQEQTDLSEEIVYNITIDRFNNGNQKHTDQVKIDDPYAYHGGDLLGITQRLDHIEELGFTAISLSPVMENRADGYHGYWIEDFFSVEEQFGTIDDLETLIEEAHARGIKVFLEMVINYAADTHPFTEDANKQDWFKEVERNSFYDESTYWLDEVVVFDQTRKDVQAYLQDVVTFWIEELEIDGLKLHAADQADPNLLSNLTQHIKDLDENLYILAHVLDPEADIEELRKDENLDGIENHRMYQVMQEVFAAEEEPIEKIYEGWQQFGDEKDLHFVDHQNVARFANFVADHERDALTMWQLALTYLYTTPGTPSIYQGTELKMFGPGFPENQMMMRFNSSDPDLEEFIHRLTSLREQFVALRAGSFEQVATEEGLSVFERTFENETLYVAINNNATARETALSDIPEGKQLRGLFEDTIIRANNDSEFVLTIPRESVEIFIVQENVGINWPYISFVALVFIIFGGSIIYLSRKQKARERQGQ